MRCPYCEDPDTRVVDSRPTEEGHAIRRRRFCDQCGRRFTTYEKLEPSILMIVKKDGGRESYDRNKVLKGFLRACEKRPVSIAEIENMASRVERRLYNLLQKEVKSDVIGEFVMDELRSVDQVAYIRFASVYREFTDVNTFTQEIEKLKSTETECIRIALDGPSGAGKSSVAKVLASRLGIDYIDTGAMYRAIGYKVVTNGIDVENEEELNRMLAQTDIDFVSGAVYLDGIDISGRIRTPEISAAASRVAAIGAVREKLVEAQRQIGHVKSVVMDGRDIGTHVFPDAQFKFYLTASVEERARRRFLELKDKDPALTIEDVQKDISQRDYNDTHRDLNPLRKADDAVEIDSSDMTFDEVVDTIYNAIQG